MKVCWAQNAGSSDAEAARLRDIYFSVIIFLRSATAALVTGEVSTCLEILSQELMKTI